MSQYLLEISWKTVQFTTLHGVDNKLVSREKPLRATNVFSPVIAQ